MKNIITLLLLLDSLFCFAQNAALDPNFGNAGYSVHPHPYTAEIMCFDFDQSGNIISAGYARQGGAGTYNYRLTLTRTDSNGILDANFGTNGKVTTTIEYSEFPKDIVIQSDGKIIVVGHAYLGPTPTGPGDYIGFAVRYNIDGSLDTTFAINGIFTEARSINSVILLPDDSIILAGYTNTEGVIIKLDNNGLFDSSFGTNGILLLNSFIIWNSILLSDGKIFCVGLDNSAGVNRKIAYCKIDMQGTFDISFGQNGKVVEDLYNNAMYNYSTLEVIKSTKELPNNKIILEGYIYGDFYSSNFLAKINSDGSLDTTFGTNGMVYHSYPYIPSTGFEIQPDGKIIIGGTKMIGAGNLAYSITRFNSDGSLDTTFNNGSGFVDVDATPEDDYLHYIKFQATDTLIIGGASKLNANNVGNFTLARILLDTSLSIEEPLEQFVKIYPNPFEERFFIEDYEQVIEEIKIFDNTGRLIKDISNPNTIQEIYTDFSSGVYHINIKSKDGRIMNRKVIRK